MAMIVSSSNPTRLQGVLRTHYKFGMNFSVDAQGNYLPIRNSRTLLEYGVDDTLGSFVNAGYTNAVQTLSSTSTNGNIEFTTAQKGGALSQNLASLILALSFMPEHTPRVGLLADGTADPTFTAAAVPRRGGIEGDVEAGLVGRLFATGFKGSQLSLLPPGNVSGCSAFIGIPQLLTPGTGFNNSEIPSMGFPSASTRFTMGDDIITLPSRLQGDFQPNRIVLDFPTQLTAAELAAGSQDEPIELPNGAPTRPAGTIVCLDMILIVDYANIVLFKADGTPVDVSTTTGADVARYEPASDFDDIKIKSFRRCV